MSRHRNVRSMKYEDDFGDEDDDYLGHSVEDSYCISPGTAAQFTFNRDKNVDLSHYMEEGIPEEDEEDSDGDHSPLNNSSGTPRLQLNDTDQATLNSCLDEVRSIVGESCPEHLMAQTIVKNNYNIQASLNELLNLQDAPKPQRQPRESRRNRSQGDDDDFDEFLQSLESQSPNDQTHLFSDNFKQSVGIMKYGGSWSSESSFENLNKSGLKFGNSMGVNYSSAGSSECLSSTPDANEMTDIRKPENCPGLLNCISSTPDDILGIGRNKPEKDLLKLVQNNIIVQDLPDKKSLGQPLSSSVHFLSLSQLANQNSSLQQSSLSHLAKQNSSLQQSSLSHLANQNSSVQQSSLSHLANQNSSVQQSLLSHLANQNSSELSIEKENNSVSNLSLSNLENKFSGVEISQPSVSHSASNLPKQLLLSGVESHADKASGMPKPPSLSDLASGMLKQPSLADLASGLPKQPSLADIASGVPKHPSVADTALGMPKQLLLADLASGLPKKPSLAELASGLPKQPLLADLASGLPKQPLIADLASGLPKQPTLANLASGMQKQLSLAELASVLPKQPSLAELASGLPKQPSLADLAAGLPKQPSLADLASGMQKQPSLVELASVIPKQPTLANLAAGLPEQPSLANLASGLPKQPSLAILASGLPKQPSLSDKLQTLGMSKQLSLADLTPQCTQTCSVSNHPPEQQKLSVNLKSLTEIANSRSSGKTSLTPLTTNGPSLSIITSMSSKEGWVSTIEGENLAVNLKSMKINGQKNEVKISLADLAGKKSNSQKVLKTEVRKDRQALTKNNDQVNQVTEVMFVEEIRHITDCEVLKLRASHLGKVLCLNMYNITSKENRKRKHFKFSYNYQMKHVKMSDNLMKKIVPFNFSTPSPDDIVKSKQKEAFTRSGDKK